MPVLLVAAISGAIERVGVSNRERGGYPIVCPIR